MKLTTLGSTESISGNGSPRLFIGDGLRHHEIRVQAGLSKKSQYFRTGILPVIYKRKGKAKSGELYWISQFFRKQE